MERPHTYCEYVRPVWPWQWVRWWVARWRDRRRGPLNDGQDYVGWSARVVDDTGRDGMALLGPPVGQVGTVTGSEVQCGELVHHIDFEGWVVTTPLKADGIELIRPS